MSNILALATECDAGDDAIVARILDGDSRFFAVLVRRHNQTLYRAARAIMRDDGEAEEALQQAYVSAFRHLRAYERGPMLRWLMPIVIDEARARHARQLRLEAVRRERWGEDEAPMSGEVAVARPAVQRLEAAIDALPEAYRVVLVLRDVSELRTADAADVLEVSESNVRVRLFRGREMLRRSFHEPVDPAAAYPFCGRRAARMVLSVMHEIFSETPAPTGYPTAG